MIALTDTEIKWLEQLDASVLQFNRGIEKEGLRVNELGQLQQDDHPRVLGSALTHPAITTDYSESLLEFITPVHGSVADALHYLAQLHKFTLDSLPTQRIWAGSMPPYLRNELSVRIAEYGSSNVGRIKHYYRHGLWHRYGRKMQSIAGLHYNFSVSDELFQAMAQQQGVEFSQDFKSEKYFGLLRNFRRYSWILSYLFGASPAFDDSFDVGRAHTLAKLDPATRYGDNATSWRMSDIGYSNQAQKELYVCFNSIDSYCKTLTRAIAQPWPDYFGIGLKEGEHYKQLNHNVLQIENEYYSDIRPKRTANSGEKPIHALQERGVEYVEVRCLDLNPFEPVGLCQQQADFVDLYLLWSLMHDSPKLTHDQCRAAQDNLRRVLTQGRDTNLMLHTDDGEQPLIEVATELMQKLQPLADLLDEKFTTKRYSIALEMASNRVQDSSLTPSARLISYMKYHHLSYQQAVLKLSNEHVRYFEQLPYDESLLNTFETMAEESLVKQQQLESQDEMPFDEFLANYLA